MAVQVLCPNPACRKALSVAEEFAGRPTACPACQQTFRLSMGSSSQTVAPSGTSTGGGDATGPTEVLKVTDPEAVEVIGKYKVTDRLGEGAFGVVYKGRDEALGRNVAIKLLKAGALASKRHVDRFLREARVVAQMHQDNIVPVYELGQHAGGYYIASAFVPGQTLGKLIKGGPVDPVRAVKLVVQLLDALSYAHQVTYTDDAGVEHKGVLHRDVKPDNAMVNASDKLFLMDFGLAGLLGQEDGRVTQAGTVLGTACYMPPEQARGDLAQVGPHSDQYSAGVVLYELLTGDVPFDADNLPAILFAVTSKAPPRPSAVRPGLDLTLERLCLKALAKKPEQRYESCSQFAAELRKWLARPAAPPAAPAGSPAVPPPVPAGSPAAPPVQHPQRRKPASAEAAEPKQPAGQAATPASAPPAKPRPKRSVDRPVTVERPVPVKGVKFPVKPGWSPGWGVLILLGLALLALPALGVAGLIAYTTISKGEPTRPPGILEQMNKDGQKKK